MSNNPNKLRVLIFGAGAIGTYIGGCLFLAGNDVVFIERDAAKQVIDNHGMRLMLGGSSYSIHHPTVVNSIKRAFQYGEYDVAVIAIKAYDTHSLAKNLAHFRKNLPPILCLQNGVASEKILGEAIGDDNIIPGTVTSAIGRNTVGDIILEKSRGVGIANTHALSNRLANVFNSAGIVTKLFSRPNDMKWSKLLTNLLANATSAIFDMSPAEIFTDRSAFKLEVNQLREALLVMDAMGIYVTNLPGTPVKLLAFIIRRLPLQISQLLLNKTIAGARGQKMPSLHIDLHSGQHKSEVEFLNGAVVQAGQHSGVPTPVNALLTCTLGALVEGRLLINTYRKQPHKLLRELGMIGTV